jgi:predicted permease
VPRLGEAHVDWPVLSFALSVSLLCSVLFGLAPALRVRSRGLDDALRSGGRTLGGVPRRLHAAFVASEIALAVVLLVCAGVLGRALLSASAHDPGLDVRNVLVARTALSPGALANPAQTRAAWAEVLESARSVPGVRSVALVDTVPMREGYNELTYSTTPGPQRAGEGPVALATCVTPDYLRVMRIPLLAGRFFDDRDHPSAQPVIVIDEVLARTAFPGRQAVGQKLWVPDLNPAPLEIAGVVGHVRHWGLASDDQARVRAQVYYPFAQLHDRFLRRWSELMSIAVRSDTPPLSVLEPLRHRVRGAASDQVLYEVRTLEQLASASLDRQRFLLFLFGIFATVALVLACIGIYGVLAYLTNRRVPEIGLRVALGASGANVTRLVVRQSLGMTLAGVGAGTVGALAAARILERLVDGVRAVQPATFGIMVALLVAAALVAAFIPARRASRVDVMTALRQD